MYCNVTGHEIKLNKRKYDFPVKCIIVIEGLSSKYGDINAYQAPWNISFRMISGSRGCASMSPYFELNVIEIHNTGDVPTYAMD